MSMNIYIAGTRKAWTKNKAGKKVQFEQTDEFPVVQTPTKVTYEIMNASDKKQVYIDYVMSQSEVQTLPIYHDDVFCEEDPIGYFEYDWSKEHIEQFEDWWKDTEEQGFDIKFGMS